MARKVFISVLGFTNYSECIYAKDAYKSHSVRFIQEATLDYLLQQSEWTSSDVAYIMLTDGAEKANWMDNGHRDRVTGEIIACEGLQTRLENMQLPFDVQTISHLPHGNNENEIWEIFEETFKRLQDGDELYFDLTHGFRYLPMLVIVLINYSKFLKNVSVKSITYGNFESRNDRNEAPIIDLLPLSMLQDWTYASGQFLESGNVQRLIELSKTKIKPIMISSKGKDKEALLLTGFTNYLGGVVDDFQTCRGVNIWNATNVLKLCASMTELQSTFIKPLNPVFEKLRTAFDGYAKNNGMRNLMETVKWCLDKGLYQQAITIFQEGILTYICESNQIDSLDVDLRTLVSGAINLYSRQEDINSWKFPSDYSEEQIKAGRLVLENVVQSEALQKFAKTYVACSALRNDLNHSGMRVSPQTAQNIKKGIVKIVNQTLDNVNGIEVVLAENATVRNRLLINLSNHPYETWGDKQKNAAAEYGEVIDMAFPMVDANDDEAYIKTLADDFFQRIIEYAEKYKVTVHLMGELTFTFALLKLLQERGIGCIASTSKRIVKEEVPGKKEEVIFEFERFREYC